MSSKNLEMLVGENGILNCLLTRCRGCPDSLSEGDRGCRRLYAGEAHQERMRLIDAAWDAEEVEDDTR